jgi:glycosyltransferase involved in cell wall biosynthesis
MKVLFVSEYYPPKIMGGGEINLASLAESLAMVGEDVSVITSYHKGLQRYEEASGVKVYRRIKTGSHPTSVFGNVVRAFSFPKSVKKEVKKLSYEKKFDIIHFIGASIIASKKLSSFGVPLVATIESLPCVCPKGDRFYHGKQECKVKCDVFKFLKCQAKSKEIGLLKNKFFLKYNPLFLAFVYYRYKKLNKSLKYCKLIAISKYIGDLLSKYESLSSAVIPNSISSERFYSKENKNKKPKILYLGSLTRYKGPHLILDALEGIDVRVDFYGKGPLKKELEDKIITRNIDGKVNDPVSYDQVPDLYAAADVIVFPSIWPEPFGRIAIEALSAGKTIIGARSGAIPEVIENKGILFDSGNVESLKSALKKALSNFQIDPKEKIKIKEYVKQRFSKEIVIEKTIKVYGSF